MAAQSRRQSLRAVLGFIAAAAILISMRSIYQGMRHQEEMRRAEAREEASRPADWEQQVESARKTAEGQLEAFKRGDWKKAFTYASASFHEQMKVEDFRGMVERGYPQIARPAEIHLGKGDWHAGGVEVEVTVTGKDGGKGRYLYTLAPEDGEWRVVGVNDVPDGGPSPRPTAPPPYVPSPGPAPRSAPAAGGSA